MQEPLRIYESLEDKIEAYTLIIRGMIGNVNAYPLSFDYSEELSKLYKKHPNDKGAIFAAEKLAYERERGK